MRIKLRYYSSHFRALLLQNRREEQQLTRSSVLNVHDCRLGFVFCMAYLFCEQFQANFSSQWLERKRLFRSIPCAHKSSATTTIRSSQDMIKETRKKRSPRRWIRKQAHGENGARDGQAQRLPVVCCPGPEVGGCYFIYFFTSFFYFNLKTKKIDFIIIIIVVVVAFLLSYSSFKLSSYITSNSLCNGCAQCYMTKINIFFPKTNSLGRKIKNL